MRSNTNWPYGTNLGGSNWTSRYQRVGSWNQPAGLYAEGSARIPLSGWLGCAAVLLLVFGLVPFLNFFMGGV